MVDVPARGEELVLVQLVHVVIINIMLSNFIYDQSLSLTAKF